MNNTAFPRHTLSGLRDGTSLAGAGELPRDDTDPERVFTAVVQSSGEAIITIDLDAAITTWNPAATRILGYPAEDTVGKTIDIIVPPEQRDDMSSIIERALRGEQIEICATVREALDGRLVDVSWRICPIRSQSGAIIGAVTFLRDVSGIGDREREAARLARDVEELRRSNIELEQFAYVASHELLEPLRMVVNFTRLLAERCRGKLDDKSDQYIRHALDGAKRMQHLVRSLLHFSRVTAAERSLGPVNSASVVKSVLAGLSATIAECDAEVTTGTLPLVVSEETELGQVFQNLIANALKFRSDHPVRVRVDARRDGDDWVFRVQDNGIGIDDKHRERIFEMFHRLHQRGKYEGTGIGLALVKKIVERQGGRIWVESKPGHGATFFFTVPDKQVETA